MTRIDDAPDARPAPPADDGDDALPAGGGDGAPPSAKPATMIVDRTELTATSGNTFIYLVRFALANIGRRPERFALSVLGIALAIACVVVVRTIAASFAITGADSVNEVIGDAQLWVVPAAGVHYEQEVDALVADGAAPTLQVPDGWRAVRTLSGVTEINGTPVSVHGTAAAAPGVAVVPTELATTLSLTNGASVTIAGTVLQTSVGGSGKSITVPESVGQAVAGTNGWWTVYAPAGDEADRDLGARFGAATSLPDTSDPSVSPDPAGSGLIYDTVGGSGPLSFDQKYSALFSGKVTSSTLGLISIVGLILGFIIAVSSFLASVQERRREFGIMAAIGLADEVLYFFLVESAIVFLAAYVIAVLGAGLAVALVIPQIATVTAWAQAAGMVFAFLPAMSIVGALIPVHRLLQQRPIELLANR